jgi:hypothetical protein
MESSTFERTVSNIVSYIIIFICIILLYLAITNTGDVMTRPCWSITYYSLISFLIFTFILSIKAMAYGLGIIDW